mmetsp:Transcript_8556/g.10243  ORF Transcript_8556/g.10243 Transcript_8556/m.10243 type:complete len:92 (-) Transcript_8556:384-659(-)
MTTFEETMIIGTIPVDILDETTTVLEDVLEVMTGETVIDGIVMVIEIVISTVVEIGMVVVGLEVEVETVAMIRMTPELGAQQQEVQQDLLN